jgi:hypothetical protein
MTSSAPVACSISPVAGSSGASLEPGAGDQEPSGLAVDETVPEQAARSATRPTNRMARHNVDMASTTPEIAVRFPLSPLGCGSGIRTPV